MKEIIYTAVFLALAVILAVIIFFMFGPGKTADNTAAEKSRYKPGVYTSSICRTMILVLELMAHASRSFLYSLLEGEEIYA